MTVLAGAALALATMTTAGPPAHARSTAPATPPVSVSTAMGGTATPAELERRVIQLTNERRADAGCNPVRFRKTIRKAARRHSHRMAAVGYPDGLDHQLPGEPALGRRLSNAGYTGWTRIGENIAFGYPTARAVMQAWMRSPSHRHNILDCRFRHIGVGVVFGDDGTWWTQDFGRK